MGSRLSAIGWEQDGEGGSSKPGNAQAWKYSG